MGIAARTMQARSRTEKARDDFLEKLKRRHITGSHESAKKVVELLRDTASATKWSNCAELMDVLKGFIQPLIAAGTAEALIIGNVIRHVLWIIREEYNEAEREEQAPAQADASSPDKKFSMGERTKSLHNMLTQLPAETNATRDYTKRLDVKGPIMEHLVEYLNEIQDIHKNIADQALDHLHANEIVLTIGNSKTVEKFLSKAAAKREGLEVFVCEAAPCYEGQKFALHIASKDQCKVTVVTDAAVFALMSRVNKVIIGAHAVMANGAVLSTAGSRAVAQAAKHFSVPVVVCTGMYKLSPLYPSDLDALIRLECPSQIIPFSAETAQVGNVHVYNPAFDYIPPELVTLFITNNGGHSPSYIYRLISEYYAPEDYSLDQ